MNGVRGVGRERPARATAASVNASATRREPAQRRDRRRRTSASGTSTASIGTITFRPVPSLVLVISVASIATASAAEHLQQRRGRAAAARRATTSAAERDEPDQAPERLAPDALEDVQPAPAGGHLRDHAVVPEPEAEDRGERDAPARAMRDRRADGGLLRRRREEHDRDQRERVRPLDERRDRGQRAGVAPRSCGRAASSAAPSSTGGASSSGVSAPCSRSAHGVSRLSAGAIAVAQRVLRQPPDGDRGQHAGAELREPDGQAQERQRVVDPQRARAEDELPRRLRDDDVPVEVAAVQEQPRGVRVHALAVVPVLDPAPEVQGDEDERAEQRAGGEGVAAGHPAAQVRSGGRA